MRLILATLLGSIFVGYLARGRLIGIAAVPLRGAPMAVAGVLLQFIPLTGTIGFVALLASFVLLVAFVAVNIRATGFMLVLVGLALNLAVIAANQGMPVSRQALVASGQEDTLADLREHPTKHHLASDDEILLFLGDVIPIGPPIRQAVSVGDLAVHAGAFVFVVTAMRRRVPELGPASESVAAS